jgi:hypothetical protein
MSPTKPSLDAIAKQQDLDGALEQARTALGLETLETRKRDALDFHDLAVWSIRDLVRQAFEAGYAGGLHAGYRQGRSDACAEVGGGAAPANPRNPQIQEESRHA